jgi:DNA-binding CsgD family transcriptional regulator
MPSRGRRAAVGRTVDVVAGPSTTESGRHVAELALIAREALNRTAFIVHALQKMNDIVPFDSAVFSRSEASEPLTTIGVEPSAVPYLEACERNFDDYVSELQPGFEVAARDGGVIDHDVFGADFRRASRFYAEIVRPQGIESVLMLLPRWRRRSLGLLRFERHTSRRFDRDDLARLLALMPVFELALVVLPFAAPGDRLSPLTRREGEIAEHVARGLTTPQIAALLGTSRFTIRNQISRLFDKTRTSSRSELAAWIARRSGAP